MRGTDHGYWSLTHEMFQSRRYYRWLVLGWGDGDNGGEVLKRCPQRGSGNRYSLILRDFFTIGKWPPLPPLGEVFFCAGRLTLEPDVGLKFFKKRKMFRIEFPEILAWFQTPQTNNYIQLDAIINPWLGQKRLLPCNRWPRAALEV